jgi:hypothetical protein
MDLQRLKADVRKGTADPKQVVEVVEKLESTTHLAACRQREVRQLQVRVKHLEERLAKYEPPPKTPEPATDFSVGSEQKRRTKKKKNKPQRQGRRPFAEKRATVADSDWKDVYPENAPPDECVFVRERLAWRLVGGKAVFTGYRLHRRRGELAVPPVPGVLPRSEFGFEFVVLIAFLMFVVRVPLDKVCLLLGFFCGLKLEKSQANALLDQLARRWEPEFDALCELLILSRIVYMDETSWKIGKDGCSLWVFLTVTHTVLLFGCRKDAATLDKMLPPDLFQGIGVSDDAAVYFQRFSEAQKCWGHLLRKAIKLSLLYPDKAAYTEYLDSLFEIFRRAQKAREDGRLSDAGRAKKVDELHDAIWYAAEPHQPIWEQPRTPDEKDFANLVLEIHRLVGEDELFTFVRHPEVEPTNNGSEQEIRDPALDRDAGRTNKSEWGAKRRSIIQSVLASLKKQLETFSLASVLDEAMRWLTTGTSRFRDQLSAARAELERLAAEATPAVERSG